MAQWMDCRRAGREIATQEQSALIGSVKAPVPVLVVPEMVTGDVEMGHQVRDHQRCVDVWAVVEAALMPTTWVTAACWVEGWILYRYTGMIVLVKGRVVGAREMQEYCSAQQVVAVPQQAVQVQVQSPIQ